MRSIVLTKMAHTSMTNRNEMYKCGSVYGKEVYVELPCCMYRTKSIYCNLDNVCLKMCFNKCLYILYLFNIIPINAN